MTTESAKIIIDADDLASKKLAVAAANAEKNIKHIKEVGGKAKASTEFFGQLANTLGGSQLAGHAGQMAALTEKIGQFSEVSKLGTAGTLAFKAGLLGLAGAITFKVSTAIGQLIFDLDGLDAQLRKVAAAEAEGLTQLSALRDKDIRERLELAELQAELAGRDPDKEKAAIQEELRSQIRQTNEEISKATKEIEEYESSWLSLDRLDQNTATFIETEKERVAALKATVAQMQVLERQVSDDLSETKKVIDATREQIAAKKEKERADEMQAEKVKQLLQDETDKIEEQRIELEKGKEAAKAFALEKLGLSKADASRLAAEQAEIDKQKELRQIKDKQESSQGTPSLSAFESRLLTRGPAVNKALEVANKQLNVLQQVRDRLPLSNSPSQRNTQLVVVG